MTRRTLLAIVFGFAFSSAEANEPGWTDVERAERSTVVFTGEVVSIERALNLNEAEDLYRAVVAISSVSKGEAAAVRNGEQIALYFERPREEPQDKRCPSYVSLKIKQRAQFYVRLRKIGLEWKAFLEMGADVSEVPS